MHLCPAGLKDLASDNPTRQAFNTSMRSVQDQLVSLGEAVWKYGKKLSPLEAPGQNTAGFDNYQQTRDNIKRLVEHFIEVHLGQHAVGHKFEIGACCFESCWYAALPACTWPAVLIIHGP